MRRDAEKLAHDRRHWERIRSTPNSTEETGAALNNRDFEFILCNGGTIIEDCTPTIDNCYIHRAELTTTTGIIYRFKTLTEQQRSFYPPF